MPRAIESEQFLQHAMREPSPCEGCPRANDCAEAEMACEAYYSYVTKLPEPAGERIPSAYWLVQSER